MPRSIHLSTARTILNAHDPVDIKVWKRDGSILSMSKCVSLRYDFYSGVRNIKILSSGQIRKIRDVCIFEINGMTVFI